MADLVYLSFSSIEEMFRNELRTVLLRDIRLQELVWDDKCLSPGDDYPIAFDVHVARTRIMVMLVSPRYLDSERCQAWKYEIPQAIAAHEKGELTIMWIPIRAVRASDTPFPNIQSALPLSTPLADMDFDSRQRAYDELRSKIRRKLGLDKSGLFDVFLSHNSKDKPRVRELCEKLKRCGLQGWLDEEQLRPGIPWQQLLEEGVKSSSSIAVLVGNDGLGPWEDEEMQGALRLAVKDKRAIIPVLLPGAPTQPRLPMFLGNRTWVDLREGLTEAGVGKLVWGITGKKPGQSTSTDEIVSQNRELSAKPTAPVAVVTANPPATIAQLVEEETRSPFEAATKEQAWQKSSQQLLESSGKDTEFEIDSYETTLTVSPVSLDAPQVVKHGTKSHEVLTYNSAVLLRTIQFSASNQRKAPFEIKYSTLGDGFVQYSCMPLNEAPSEDLIDYEMHGKSFCYRFTPDLKKPLKKYTLRATIYKGFDKGDRDIHFHLGFDKYYHKLAFSLDLRAYTSAGYVVTKAPRFLFSDKDLGVCDSCKEKLELADEVQPKDTGTSGLWRWELTEVRQGMTYLSWDVALSSEAGPPDLSRRVVK
jgi:hypothetical protein